MYSCRLRTSLFLRTLCDPSGPLFFMQISEVAMICARYLSWALGVSQLSRHFESAGSVFWVVLVFEEILWLVPSLDSVLVLLYCSFCILPVRDSEGLHVCPRP